MKRLNQCLMFQELEGEDIHTIHGPPRYTTTGDKKGMEKHND